MKVDHRTMKAMLQAQLAPSLQFGAPGNKQKAESDVASVFNNMLSVRLAGGMAGDGYTAGNVPVWSPELWARIPQAGFADAAVASAHSAVNFRADAAPFAGIVQSAAAKYGVEGSLVHAVIRTESSYNPLAQSHAGAKGLMQLMDGTARGLGVTDSFDPVQNIDGGTRYLALLLNKYNGHEGVALAAYNAGPGRIDRLGISTDAELHARLHELPAETQRYVVKVLEAKA